MPLACCAVAAKGAASAEATKLARTNDFILG
jgi:hypothetical protein